MKTLQLVMAIVGMLAFANVAAAPKDFELHQAVLDNDLQLVSKFLSKGAYVNQIGSRKYGYGSALHLAVREGHLKIAQLLLEHGAQVDVLDPDDFTPLHNAAWNGNLEVAQLLLEAGADIEASTYDGDTPLTLAQNNDQAKMAEYILENLVAPSTVTAKVETQATGDAGVIDISGIYTTEVTYRKDVFKHDYPWSFGRKPDIAISIEQQGNVIIGVISGGRSGEIEGVLKGNEITYEFYICGVGMVCKEGKGTWLVSDNHTLLSGTWKHSMPKTGFVYGKWNLTKIEAETDQVMDVTGTYSVTELVYPGHYKNWSTWYFGKGKDLKMTIEQSGDVVSGTFSGDATGEFKGEIKGNEITFDYDSVSPGGSSRYGSGVLMVGEGSAELVGTFRNHFFTGKWKFRKDTADSKPPSLTGTTAQP